MSFKISKFFLYAAVFCIAIVSTTTLFPFIVGKYAWFRSSVDLALIFFLIGIVKEADGDRYWKRFKKILVSPLGLTVSAFTLIFLLAGFFGVDPHSSFWSNFERGEGGLQMLHLYFFFMLIATCLEEEKQWLKLFYCSFITALLMIGYGVLAGLKPSGILVLGPAFGTENFRFQGSIGNPAYVAVYLLFILFYALYTLFTKYRRELKSPKALFLMFLILVFAVFFILAATRGAFLGLIAAAVVFLCYVALSYKKFRKAFMALAIFVVLFMALGVKYKDSPIIKKLPFARIFDISLTTQTFEDRRTIWKMAWDGFKEKPLLGYGPENFLYVFDAHFNINYFKPPEPFGAWFDRAHSIIFDYLAETGILGLLSFASIFFAFYWLAIKNSLLPKTGKEQKPQAKSRFSLLPIPARALIFAFPVAYLVQGLVLFDVLATYINIFLLLGFSYYIFESEPIKK